MPNGGRANETQYARLTQLFDSLGAIAKNRIASYSCDFVGKTQSCINHTRDDASRMAINEDGSRRA